MHQQLPKLSYIYFLNTIIEINYNCLLISISFQFFILLRLKMMDVKNTYKVVPILISLLVVGCDTNSESPSIDLTETPKITTQQETQKTPNLEIEPIKAMPTVPRPTSGIYAENLSGQQAIAPLEIRTDSSGADYYVKLVNVATNEDTLTMFIRGGEAIEVEVPLGNYEIRYAAGSNWYGDIDLFGSDTSYSKADTTFNFVDNGYQISGYSLTLYQVVNGNLETKSLDKNQF